MLRKGEKLLSAGGFLLQKSRHGVLLYCTLIVRPSQSFGPPPLSCETYTECIYPWPMDCMCKSVWWSRKKEATGTSSAQSTWTAALTDFGVQCRLTVRSHHRVTAGCPLAPQLPLNVLKDYIRSCTFRLNRGMWFVIEHREETVSCQTPDMGLFFPKCRSRQHLIEEDTLQCISHVRELQLCETFAGVLYTRSRWKAWKKLQVTGRNAW